VIVARWPAATPRDANAEAAIGELLELITGIRNARAEAVVEPGAWLPAVVSSSDGSAADLEALRPSIERLARARPLRIVAGGSLPRSEGSLAVGAGRLEAVVEARGVGDAGLRERERERLGRELAEAERRLAAARARLADSSFTARAPEHVVAGARASEADLAGQVERLREKLSE
jgi:valyl-tRNA synthetase